MPVESPPTGASKNALKKFYCCFFVRPGVRRPYLFGFRFRRRSRPRHLPFYTHPPSTEVATLKSPLDPLLLAALECPEGGSLRSEGEWQYINNNIIIILRVLCGHHLLQGVKSQHADPQ